MDFQGKAKRTVIYPSFTLVVNRHLLRCVSLAYRRRVVWKGIPNYHPYPLSLRNGDWAMRTVDLRGEDDLRRVCRPVEMAELAARIDPFVADTSANLQPEPEPVYLPPVDDDAISYVSFLDLDGEQVTDDGDWLARIRRVSKGTRILYTCKSFLEHCIRSVRRKKATTRVSGKMDG